MPNRHAILGPSGAYRWIACTPSARFEEQIPEEESAYAREGTIAHEIAAVLLSYWAGQLSNKDADIAYARAVNDALEFYLSGAIEVDDPQAAVATMVEHSEAYATYVLSHGGEILVEREYDLSRFVPLSFGTSDGTNLLPKVLYITDFKFGAGKAISAVNNTQLKLYGLGALLEAIDRGYRPVSLVLTIFQPRVGEPSIFEISVKDLLLWAEVEVAPRALLAISGQGDFVPGKHCDFCKARTVCKAYYDKFDDLLKIQDKRLMTNADTATVLTYGAMVAAWVKKVEQKARGDMQAGRKIPGFKLVSGRGDRAFRDEDAVIDILLGLGYDSDEIFKTEIKGITAYEQLLGPARFKEVFAGIIYNKDTQPKVVSRDDPAPAIDATAADAYNDNEDLT